jgi:hypothetical protein
LLNQKHQNNKQIPHLNLNPFLTNKQNTRFLCVLLQEAKVSHNVGNLLDCAPPFNTNNFWFCEFETHPVLLLMLALAFGHA